ncbi:hypothetical protein A9Q84_16885 [Halobacteriovorax marinus]|uniref:Porin domain-containing protein n=1 Tax=Halobacteriovorax marinus TaxID=97084 RepID=A0A1Y5F4J7_9BACT|nr:hypothetical protein A9Q84_16885 [Halobacteriovorax marinus]
METLLKIKKKLGIFIWIILLSPTVFANHQLVLEGRLDYVSTDNDTTKTGNPNTTSFTIPYFFTAIKGTANDKFDYFIKLNFSKVHASKNNTDNTTDFLQAVRIDHKLNKNLTFQLGKQFTGVGGFENDYSASSVYEYSLTSDGPVSFPVYETGISAHWTGIKDQTLILTLLNADKATTGGGSNSQRNISLGLLWYGNLFDKMLSTNFSYTYKPTSRTNGATDTYLSLGSRFTLGKVYFEIDYLDFETEKSSSGNTDETATSLVGKINFNFMEKHNTFIKYADSEYKLAGTKDYEQNLLVLAYEYEVIKDFIYSASYTSKDISPVAGSSTTASTINSIRFAIAYEFQAL